jgi:para-aminobenzoate synthetase/4-amino-4-deoxychorismate lyase
VAPPGGAASPGADRDGAAASGGGAAGPDRDRGLFETMLVAAGRPVALDVHLARLAASLREVFGVELPDAVAAETIDAARELELGRMRIDVTPAADGNSFGHAVRAVAIDPAIFFPPRRDGADLIPVHPPAWDGAHKWADRDWLESLEAELGDDDVPVILAPDDDVLEAGRANVFAVLDGALATPPVDDRILPGTARAAVLALAAELGIETAERRLTLADLEAADDVFLTSSVRGIRPARSLAGRSIDPAGDLTERLAHELRSRWLSDRS